jgi:DNA invertase Pin-like site-specific DNA recombinase
VRFSTPEQAKGDSQRRQTEKAAKYAAENGLELDTELRLNDLGVSAYRNRNAKTGALSVFLDAVKEGHVAPGSFLIIENIDRLTRADILEAQELITGIIRRDITIVTLTNRQAYSRESLSDEPWAMFIIVSELIRANQESARKSGLLADVYEKKRRDAASGQPQMKPFSRMLPAWLVWSEEANAHELVPERAEVLRSIFEKADAGWSKHRIARWLNKHKVDTWGQGKRKAEFWHSSYIQKLLTNRAVIGTFTPHRATKDKTGARKRKPLDPINNYWPAVIDRDLFDRVEAQAKATAARGRNAGAEPRSIFAGVIKCGRCGGAVVRVTKGKHVYLVCSRANAKAHGCEYKAVRYGSAEQALRANARAIIEDAPRGRETAEMDEELRSLDAGVTELIWEAQELVDLTIRDKSQAAQRRLREKEAELEAAQERLRELRTRRDAVAGPNVQRRLAAVQAALEQKPLNVVEANKALKQAVAKIVMMPEAATLAIYWAHAAEPQELPFHSRHMRWDAAPPWDGDDTSPQKQP